MTEPTDKQNVPIELELLALNGGTTDNFIPSVSSSSDILDVVPVSGPNSCESILGTSPLDQRGRSRPLTAFQGTTPLCDVGAVELGQETAYVCGPPLSASNPAHAALCQFTTVQAAVTASGTGDTIVVSGIVTETGITVNKNITIRGPNLEEAAKGTHMGVVQAAQSAPTAASGSIFTVAAANTVTIKDLNIRHGKAANGGAINNAGALTLSGVTLYQNMATANGSAISNSGTLHVKNSTVSANTGSGRALHNQASGKLTIDHSTMVDNQSGNVDGVVSSTGSINKQASGAYGLGALRNNGGSTLTHAPTSSSSAVGAVSGPCSGTDQRGKDRRTEGSCDAGAVQSGSQRLVLCQECKADNTTRFTDLQRAINAAMAGDTIAIQAGIYTGNFTIYKDLTLEHAGIDVSLLNRNDSHDVRAILQASALPLREQMARTTDSGSILRIEALLPAATTIEPSGDVTVTLRGLTLRQGLSRQGGAIYNRGALTINSSTLVDNGARNLYTGNAVTTGQEAKGGAIYNAGSLRLERSTLSNNRAEYWGGAIYNDGSVGATLVDVKSSTLADNRVGRIGDRKVMVIDNTNSGAETPAFLASAITVKSGDEL